MMTRFCLFLAVCCLPHLTADFASRVLSAEVSLEINYSEEFEIYQWDMFGNAEIFSAMSPGGSIGSGFFSTLEDLNSDIAGGLWQVSTNLGDFSFELDPVEQTDFKIPTVIQPVEGETYFSGDLIPFEAFAEDVDFISRGFVVSSDYDADFEPDGFRVTLMPGVDSAPFEIVATGYISTSAFNITDPDEVFDETVLLGGDAPNVTVTVVAVPEPSSLASLASLGLAAIALRRRRRS